MPFLKEYYLLLTDLVVKSEDEREAKRTVFFSHEPLEEEEDIDMIEEDQERENHIENELIMEDYNALEEEEYVVDFDGFF